MFDQLLILPLLIVSAMGIFLMLFCLVQMFAMVSEAIDWLLNNLF